MKLSYIIGIVVIAVAVGILISTAGDASSYVTFQQAREMAEDGQSKMIHVVGKLDKNQAGEIVGIEASDYKQSFKFVMVDEDNKKQEVFYNEPMPTDFLKSEQVVVVGAYQNDLFVADHILLKCPSKYQEEEIKV